MATEFRNGALNHSMNARSDSAVCRRAYGHQNISNPKPTMIFANLTWLSSTRAGTLSSSRRVSEASTQLGNLEHEIWDHPVTGSSDHCVATIPDRPGVIATKISSSQITGLVLYIRCAVSSGGRFSANHGFGWPCERGRHARNSACHSDPGNRTQLKNGCYLRIHRIGQIRAEIHLFALRDGQLSIIN